MRALLAAMLLAWAGGAGAQATQDLKDPQGQTQSIRIPKGGVAPPIDLRIQDDGLRLPRGVQQDEPLKTEEKPAAKPVPDTSGNKPAR